MAIKKEYSIKQIDYQTAMTITIEKHYLHRQSPCSIAFGLFDKDNKIVGVVVYGVPPSSTLLRGICGDD